MHNEAEPKPSLKSIFLFLGIMVILVIGFGVSKFPVLFMRSPYLSFMAKGDGYYVEVAHACESLMRQHPVSSNNSVELYKGMVLPFTLKLSGKDASLPKIIRGLSPDKILISTNRLVVSIPPERMGGFTIIWEPSEMQTNLWLLETDGDGLEKIVYQEVKK